VQYARQLDQSSSKDDERGFGCRSPINQSFANDDCSREIFFTEKEREMGVIDQQWHAILHSRFQPKWTNRSDRIFLHLLLHSAQAEGFRVREGFGASSTAVLFPFKKLSELYQSHSHFEIYLLLSRFVSIL